MLASFKKCQFIAIHARFMRRILGPCGMEKSKYVRGDFRKENESHWIKAILVIHMRRWRLFKGKTVILELLFGSSFGSVLRVC